MRQLSNGGQPRPGPISQTLPQRCVEITPSQEQPIRLQVFCDAYAKLFPDSIAAIEGWQHSLIRSHGEGLTVCHYILDVLPQSEEPSGWRIRENFAEKFGASFLVPSGNEAELAFGRAFENFIPGASDLP